MTAVENIADRLHAAEVARVERDHTLGRTLLAALNDDTRSADERRILAKTLNALNRSRAEEGRPPLTDVGGLADEAADRVIRAERLAGEPAGSWALSVPDEIPAVWGTGSDVAWPEGEALMIVGTDGSGKSVLAQNLALRAIGLIDDELLGFPVTERRRVAYLAQDRPDQARRSLRRMIGEIDRAILDDRLRVLWHPIDPLDADPEQLVRIAEANGADTIIVDSLKDVIVEPSEEKSGLAAKRAYSMAIANGVAVCILHHDRKPTSGTKRSLLKPSDVYGSRFITAGCGSILALNGVSGDPVVELRQLKQPGSEIGPLRVLFDFETGAVTIYEGSDLLSILRSARLGLTANDAARQMYGTASPTSAERERARRSLDRLVERQLAHKRSGHGQQPTSYFAVTKPPHADLTQGGEA